MGHPIRRCWEVDPTAAPGGPRFGDSTLTQKFTWKKKNEYLQAAGLEPGLAGRAVVNCFGGPKINRIGAWSPSELHNNRTQA